MVIDMTIDGVLNIQFAQTLVKGKGKIHGVDASEALISAATKAASSDEAAEKVCTFEGERIHTSHLRICVDDN